MVWLFEFLTLVSSLGSGNTILPNKEAPLLVKGVLGESVTLPLTTSTREEIEFITWLHNDQSITFISAKDAEIKVTDPKRKNRLHITTSYFLQINNLTTADSGYYRSQITTANFFHMSSYNLRIFRRLRNLQVVNHTQSSENGTCKIHLNCSVENPDEDVSFRWQATGNTFVEAANLTLFWNPENSSEQTLTCVAENPVSNVSLSFSVQSFCKGVFNEKNRNLDIKWIIILGLLFICIIICLIALRKKMKVSSCGSTQQTLSPAETRRNPEYDPLSPGNTVYAQVTHPNMKMEIPVTMEKNDSTTVYTTVCQSKQGNSS